MQLAKRGLLIGKFMPFHRGHEYLIDFARGYITERLHVILCTKKTDPIPGIVRYNWLKHHYIHDERVKIIHFEHDFPEYPKDEYDYAFWRIWRDGLKNLAISSIQSPNVVFASELYGKRLAKELDAEFIPCERNSIGISGTEIRNKPWVSGWDYLTKEAQMWYTRRICITGPESCGKSTLAINLAKQLKSKYVPEYGRTYLEQKGMTDWTTEDIEKIAIARNASEFALHKQAKRALLVDSDLFITKLYCEMVGEVPAWINREIEKENPYDLYLLMTPEVPWVADPLRGYDGPGTNRWEFFHRIWEQLSLKKYNYAIISGTDYDEREKAAKNEIIKLCRKFRKKHDYEQGSVDA